MRWIVHPSRARRLAHAVFVLGAALLATGGCGSDREPSAAPAGSRFGADYEIVLGESPAAPDEPPVLRGDTLTATVAYRGGEEDTARVLDEVRVPAPTEALDASTVVLLNPQGGEPFVLRWPGE
ncbi:MAG: hypothetical protein BRD38_00340 [Bacteroidetes bacterium QH_9_67_14]|nr:MAG: hypothetical protein BRD38_00340 [Bacteroidetes bacterium QH_9_67_14]